MLLFIRIALSLTLLSAFFTAPAMARGRHYTSATDLQISTQDIDSASVGRDMQLHAVQVDGKLSAGRSVTCTECHILGGVSAGHDVTLEGCPEVRHVSTGRNAEVTRSRVASHIAAGHDVILNNATVEQRVSAGNQVIAEKSSVKGLLSLGGHYARLDNSQAGDVLFSQAITGSVVSSGIQITSGNSANVNVGPGSLSSINGYTVKGAMSQTTVITPEQDIYVNGAKVSGEGPANYAEYRTRHPEAPSVRGPGWATDSPVAGKAVAKSASKAKADMASKTVVNVLELANGSVVSGQVQFDSGYGKIMVRQGSEFKGNVVNGYVEKL